MTQYLGLVLLLVGMGAFFFLWLMLINNRSKVIESEVTHTQPDKATGKFTSTTGYSLSPKNPPSALLASEQSSKALTASNHSESIGSAELLEIKPEPVLIDIHDETAKTHLEIAAQFFDMGDFEGTVEMCQLVIENSAASLAQKESALALMSRCG